MTTASSAGRSSLWRRVTCIGAFQPAMGITGFVLRVSKTSVRSSVGISTRNRRGILAEGGVRGVTGVHQLPKRWSSTPRSILRSFSASRPSLRRTSPFSMVARSGLNLAAFARRRWVSVRALYYWGASGFRVRRVALKPAPVPCAGESAAGPGRPAYESGDAMPAEAGEDEVRILLSGLAGVFLGLFPGPGRQRRDLAGRSGGHALEDIREVGLGIHPGALARQHQ